MDLYVGAKSTKPGSRANDRNAKSKGSKPARVPVGTLHKIDPAAQDRSASSYDALCGEGALIVVDVEWDGDAANDRCEQCSDASWANEFAEQQRNLLG